MDPTPENRGEPVPQPPPDGPPPTWEQLQQQWPQPPAPWGPPPPGYPHPGWAAPRPTNGFAVTAFVLAFVFFPLSFVFGPIALSQIRRRQESGRGLAIASLVISGFWFLLIAAFIVAGVSGAFDSSVSTGFVADAGSTTIGDCLRSHSPGPSEVVPCHSNHDQEVYFVQPLAAGDYPGADRVNDLADGTCLTNFRPYVGSAYADSDLDYDYYEPSAAEWAAEERRVVCVVVSDDLTNSVHGSGD